MVIKQEEEIGWDFVVDEDDYIPEPVDDIDGDIEAYERHLERRCEPLFCEFCGGAD